MTREEHLQWCKDRAIEYVEKNELQNAFTSFHNDMCKHPETANHSALELGTMLMIFGHLSTPFKMKEWINGFN